MSSAVLLMAFGGPDCAESVGPFMTRLMGREPEEALVTAVTQRYRAIGGCSPLPAIADSIAELLESELREAGHEVPVAVGMRYWEPSIGDAVDRLARSGATRLVTVSLSPFESKVSSGAYREAVVAAKARHPELTIAETPMLHAAPEFLDALTESALQAAASVPDGARAVIVFTAHSLPLDDLISDDPYIREIRGTATSIATRLGLSGGDAVETALGDVKLWGRVDGDRPWVLAYQSKGRRPGAWLEPDLDDVLEAAAHEGLDTAVICPVGFATDHMETVYDLDIVAAERARELGLAFVRAEVPNDRPQLVAALRRLIEPLL